MCARGRRACTSPHVDRDMTKKKRLQGTVCSRKTVGNKSFEIASSGSKSQPERSNVRFGFNFNPSSSGSLSSRRGRQLFPPPKKMLKTPKEPPRKEGTISSRCVTEDRDKPQTCCPGVKVDCCVLASCFTKRNFVGRCDYLD